MQSWQDAGFAVFWLFMAKGSGAPASFWMFGLPFVAIAWPGATPPASPTFDSIEKAKQVYDFVRDAQKRA